MPDYVSGYEDATKYIPSITTLSTTTRPTAANALLEVLRWESALNSVLRGAGYSTPLTNEDDVSTLALMVGQRAAAGIFTMAYEFEELPAQYQSMIDTWDKFLEMIRKGQVSFNAETPETADDPAFGIIRTPQRDDYFTERYGLTDFDE